MCWLLEVFLFMNRRDKKLKHVVIFFYSHLFCSFFVDLCFSVISARTSSTPSAWRHLCFVKNKRMNSASFFSDLTDMQYEPVTIFLNTALMTLFIVICFKKCYDCFMASTGLSQKLYNQVISVCVRVLGLTLACSLCCKVSRQERAESMWPLYGDLQRSAVRSSTATDTAFRTELRSTDLSTHNTHNTHKLRLKGHERLLVQYAISKLIMR